VSAGTLILPLVPLTARILRNIQGPKGTGGEGGGRVGWGGGGRGEGRGDGDGGSRVGRW
jgi:hypothetical protein